MAQDEDRLLKRLARRVPWIDLVAFAAPVLLALMAPNVSVAFARLDPFFAFRLFLLLWVVVHVFLTLQRFWQDIVDVRDFLRDVEKADPRLRGLTRTGDRVMLFSLWHVVGLFVRFGWPTLVLAALVMAVNTVTWFMITGWRPPFLRELMGA